jgi:predicted SprT family Zn-dependent metalloprotease
VDIMEARTLARQLMNQYGLQRWTFRIDNCRSRFGHCSWRHNRISLSGPLTYLNDLDKVRDTILHEIAHALTPYAYHNQTWRIKAQQIGANPTACYDTANVKTPTAPWHAICPKCHKDIKRYRMSRRLLTERYYCKCITLPAEENMYLKWERLKFPI